MDDVAKRREARRRKILENSQNRLNKISGIEQKSTKEFTYNNHTENVSEYPSNSFFEFNELNETLRNEVHTQGTPVSESGPPQKQYRKIVISALAVFVNVLLLLIEKLEFDSASHSNKIFLPLLVYEVIELLSSSNHRSETKNFLILLAAYFNNKYILPVIKYLEILTYVLQDVMVYFFVFVCCELVKHLLQMLS